MSPNTCHPCLRSAQTAGIASHGAVCPAKTKSLQLLKTGLSDPRGGRVRVMGQGDGFKTRIESHPLMVIV